MTNQLLAELEMTNKEIKRLNNIINNFENSWFIGWDYAHVGDFQLIGDYVEEGKEWSREELQDDCIYFIEQLRRKTKWD